MRFEFLTAVRMKMTAFWDIALCSLMDIEQHFRGAYCFHHHPDDEGSKPL
jgi:hypothetical protein